MDSIFAAVKDTLVDKALGRDDKDKDRDTERERDTDADRERASYPSSSNRNEHSSSSSYPPNQSSHGRDERRDEDLGSGYGGHGGRSQDQRPAGYGEDSSRDTRGYSRDEAQSHDPRDDDHMRGYGGHGGRAQDQRPAGYGQDSERDVRGYPRPSDDERGSGYSGHGGRAQEQGRATYGEDSERDVRGYSREEAQRDVPAGREYRAGAGANTAQEYYSGASGEYRGAVEVAERESSESGSLFSSALKMLSGSQARKDDVDEDEVVNTHKQVYGGGNTGQLGSQSLGQAAAMQALKHFTGGSGGSSGGAAAGGQNAFIGMAMAEAVKLFDTQRAQGNVAPTETKQDVVGQAAQFALKLFLKSKMDAATGGSGGGGGAGLMGLAQQFLMK